MPIVEDGPDGDDDEDKEHVPDEPQQHDRVLLIGRVHQTGRVKRCVRTRVSVRGEEGGLNTSVSSERAFEKRGERERKKERVSEID